MQPGFFHHSGRALSPEDRSVPQVAPAPVAVVRSPGMQALEEAQLIHVVEGEYDMDTVEIYRCGTVLGIRGSTWCMSPKVEKVDLAAEFSKSFYQAAREFGSLPPSAAQPLVHDSGLAERYVNTSRMSPVIYELGSEDAFKFASWFRGGPYEYYVHCDMAKNRCAAGVAMSHYDPQEDKVVVDLMLTLKAPAGGELRLSRFRQLIFELTGLGFAIGMVTFDQWQSLETQQELRLKGYNVEQYSVDRTTEAYDTLVELMLGHRLDYYRNETYITEFHALSLIDGKKVDHPEGGSKDLTDAVAASAVRALKLAKIRHDRLPGVMKMAISSSGGGGAGAANKDKAPGMPYIGGMTQESQGAQGAPNEKFLAI